MDWTWTRFGNIVIYVENHQVMKHILIILSVFSLSFIFGNAFPASAYSGCDDTGPEESAWYDVVADPESLVRRDELLAEADSVELMIYGPYLDSLDLTPDRLLDRMRVMLSQIRDSHDAWAWALAVDEDIDACNESLGHAAESSGTALSAIGDFMSVYSSANQNDLNLSYYVKSIISLYKVVAGYQALAADLALMGELDLAGCCRQEFDAWFSLNDAQFYIMDCFTYGLAHFSALPMEISANFTWWLDQRAEELQTERDILINGRRCHGRRNRRMGMPEFAEMVRFFKEDTYDTIMDIRICRYGKAGLDDEQEDIMAIVKNTADMAEKYDEALQKWYRVRTEIALGLDDRTSKAYMKETGQVMSRLYTDLSWLKEPCF